MLKPEDTRYNPPVIRRRIKEASRLLQNAQIWNAEFGLLMQHKVEIKTFMFVDPPYLGSNNDACYKHDSWNEDKFYQMVELLKSAKFKWLLTHEDCDLVRNALDGFPRHIFQWDKRQVRKKIQRSSEVYIANYPIKEIIENRLEVDLFM